MEFLNSLGLIITGIFAAIYVVFTSGSKSSQRKRDLENSKKLLETIEESEKIEKNNQKLANNELINKL